MTNTPEYWDSVYTKEGVTVGKRNWRDYPKTNEYVLHTLSTIGKNLKVLELGCGPGVLAHQIIAQGHQYVGFDHSQVVITALRSQGVSAHCASIPGALEYLSPNQFDVIVACEFLEHFRNPLEIIRLCQKIAPHAIFVVPNNVLAPSEHHEHEFLFNPQSLRLLCQSHYKNVEIEEFENIFVTDEGVLISLRSLAAHAHR